MLHALPEVVAEFPDVVYIVLGATHANELRTRGEAYRLGLEAIFRELKLESHVIFQNRFVYLDEAQSTLGPVNLLPREVSAINGMPRRRSYDPALTLIDSACEDDRWRFGEQARKEGSQC